MDKKFRIITRDVTTNEKFVAILTMQKLVYDGYSHTMFEILSIDEDTGLKDIEGNSIFENDLLFSDQFIKPVVVTYYDDLGLWTDNTYTEELYRSIHKFKLKVIGNKTENEDLLK